MTIRKFIGKTESDAKEKARAELGLAAVIMNVKEIKPKGFFKGFKSSSYEVTAAKEEEDSTPSGSSFLERMKELEDKSGGLNLRADEKITIQPPDSATETAYPRTAQRVANPPTNLGGGILPQNKPLPGHSSYTEREPAPEEVDLEKELERLYALLEKKKPDFVREGRSVREEEDYPPRLRDTGSQMMENLALLKRIYNILLENEVNEKYVNQVIDEVERVIRNGSSVDFILSNIYQKMILKLGEPKTITLGGKRPKVVFFIGPTGVGKTTTIAKVASKFKVDEGKKVALLTADTYRIAAVEQLRTYANILDAPLTIVYSPEDLNGELAKLSGFDVVLVDTAGFSHRNAEQREDVKALVDNVSGEYEKEVYLVLSATTKYRDLLEIADVYKENFDFKLLFTKLDETSCYGNVFNMKMYTGAALSYNTYGQNVPDDIEVFNTQKMVKTLLGGS
ncbi:hypothetical protein FACS1894111_02590 [Clostridia bacterium]|nr:hypothetical protein FACS1894111_02590 [Clostridia bacterium]